MRYYHLKEDKLPPKLPVRFSFKINSTIKSICEYNKDNISGIKNWKNYLEGIKSYVSDSVIAWDNTNRHIEFPNGTKFINDFDYNVGYKILEDRISYYSFVYIFMMNLNIEEFGLQYPLKITEIKQYNTMNNTNKIRLTETQLHSVIKESIKRVIRESFSEDPNGKAHSLVQQAMYILKDYLAELKHYDEQNGNGYDSYTKRMRDAYFTLGKALYMLNTSSSGFSFTPEEHNNFPAFM